MAKPDQIAARRDPFDIPSALVPDGMTYQWCAKRADSTGERQDDYEKMLDAGWVPVPRQWLRGGDNMIAGNDLMCRPKFMTAAAELDNAQKAQKQVDDWAERTGGQFSGGVRVWTGADRPPDFRVVGDAEQAARIVGTSPKVLIEPAYLRAIEAGMFGNFRSGDFRSGPLVANITPAKSRRPKYPWLAWLFNLVSTED